MYLPAGARTPEALGGGVTMRTRVEVWFGDEQIGEVGTEGVGRITGGSITDTWATGVRRALDMTVDPSEDWLEWLRIGVELRPYRGVSFGAHDDDAEVFSLGRFPVRTFTRPLNKGDSLPVRAQDRWQRVTANNSSVPRQAVRGLVTSAIATLIQEVDPWGPKVRVESRSFHWISSGLWTRGRNDVISDLCKSIGAEAFIDRDGIPVVRQRPGTHTPVFSLTTGRGGTVNSIVQNIDWEKAYNSVVVQTTATDVVLPPYRVAITDITDPAHRSNITGGTRSGGNQEFSYSSATLTTVEQMSVAARTLLRKVAAPARQYSISCIPHHGLDASDTVWVDGIDGMERAQIQQVSHPLVAGDLQQITTVSTRVDEDEEL